MLRIERIDQKLKKLQKPPIYCIGTPPLKKGDTLILCAGFEDRSVEILKRFVDTKIKDVNIIVFTYMPFQEDNKSEEVELICREGGLSPTFIEYDRQNPTGISYEILDVLRQFNGQIYVDISGMSRLLVVQLIVSLGKSEAVGFDRLNILYSEALNYPPTQERFESTIRKCIDDSIYRTFFVSSGVFEVTVVPELSSVALQGEPVRLVAFPSFNLDQLRSLEGEIQPSYYSFIHGIPPLEKNKWRTDAIKEINNIDKYKNREDYHVSTLDYAESIDCLLDIYTKHGAMNRLVISPTGSKMQAVALGLFRAFMGDTQVVYPTPRHFAKPKNYTEGVKDIYLLSLKAFSDLETRDINP